MAPALGRLRFQNPPASRVVIFDAVSSQYLSKLVLEGIPHEVLPARRETYFVSIAILLIFLRNLIHIDWQSIRRRRGHGFFGQLYKTYLLACLERMRPKVVLTWIDNSWTFQALSRIYTKAEFVAVQNGGRSVGCVSMVQYMPLPDPGYKISMPHLFCFGQYEIDLYKRFGHQVDQYHPVGSLIGGYYKSVAAPQKPAVEHDLCYVSQWQADCMNGTVRPKLRQALLILDAHLARYIKEGGLSFCIARRSNDPSELEYFRSVFGPSARIVDNDTEAFSTYKLMDRAGVIVTDCSTAAEEAMGWGKKVLFCSPLRDEEFYLPPRQGPWLVDTPDYGDFSGKLDALRGMTDEEFWREAGDFARYSMAYDLTRPPHRRVREMIEALLIE